MSLFIGPIPKAIALLLVLTAIAACSDQSAPENTQTMERVGAHELQQHEREALELLCQGSFFMNTEVEFETTTSVDKEGRSTLRQITQMSAMQIRLSEAEKLSAMMPSKADVDLERILSAADIVNSVAITEISRARALSFSVSEGDSKVTSDFLLSIGDDGIRLLSCSQTIIKTTTG